MDVGEREYDDGDGDVCGRSYVCARMEVWTLTRQKDIYSTLTRQKDIYSFSNKSNKRKRCFFLAGSRDSEEFLPLRLNDIGIRGRFHYLSTTKKKHPKQKITPLADSHCHKKNSHLKITPLADRKNSSPRKHGSNQTKRSSLNGGESSTRASSN